MVVSKMAMLMTVIFSMLLSLLSADSQSNTALPYCTERDFGLAVFPCDAKNRTRSYMFFMKKHCNPIGNDAFFPGPRHNVPCDCPAGHGLSLTQNASVVCKPCVPGDYSVGGELIDDWRYWNGSNGVPGADYRISTYCADIVFGSHCDSWHPGGNNKYLVSGPFRNSTGFLNCLQQKSMVMYRRFVNEGYNNSISFRYKVDGSGCPKTSKVCANGLHFFIDEKKVLHSDVQFRWTTFSMKVSKGLHAFRWIYQSSCKRSESPSLDVAYLEHLALVGTVDPNTRCKECPKGTYSRVNGSHECIKCLPGTYQNLTGQTSCLECPSNHFSRHGDEECIPLPECEKEDFTLVPMPVSTCVKRDERLYRKQKRLLPQWPGMKGPACHSHEKVPVPPSTVPCQCQPGYYLTEFQGEVLCQRCQSGRFSYGNTSECRKCPSGHAAISGIYIHEWPSGALPLGVVTNCSESNCESGWEAGGSFIRTQRIAGNFETYMEMKDVEINYFQSKILFQCSVDCRINPGQPTLAKDSNCFMRFTVVKGDKTIHDRDCIRYGGDEYRNGTVMNHTYSLGSSAVYTFRWLFHHGDESDSSLFSYEGRVYQIEIDGVKDGSAKTCQSCPSGTYVSEDGSLCVKCPKGSYSKGGTNKCKKCSPTSFAAEPGSSSCIECGNNTRSNATRDGCDFNNCIFYAGNGTYYDLSPLGKDGGPMTKVQTWSGTGTWYNIYYYVNPCYVNHDNSSCLWRGRMVDENGNYQGYGTTILRAMACKRWAFDPSHSYSLGHVLGYLPNRENPEAGITLQLLDGYPCYNRHRRLTVPASTHIDLICDLTAGRGYPTQVNNHTAIEERPCFFRMKWRSIYACPVCQDYDYETVHTDCVDGFMNITTVKRRRCRSKDGESYEKQTIRTCQVSTYSLKKSQRIRTILIVLIVIFTLILFASLGVIFVLCKRNHAYRLQLFSSGKTLAQLKNKDASDFQELISGDTY